MGILICLEGQALRLNVALMKSNMKTPQHWCTFHVCQKKDGCDNDKDLKVCFLVTRVVCQRLKWWQRWPLCPKKDNSYWVHRSNGSVVIALTDTHTHRRMGPILLPRPLTWEVMNWGRDAMELRDFFRMHAPHPIHLALASLAEINLK